MATCGACLEAVEPTPTPGQYRFVLCPRPSDAELAAYTEGKAVMEIDRFRASWRELKGQLFAAKGEGRR